MLSYHVFFNPKPDVTEEAVIDCTKRLMADLVAAKQIGSQRLLKVTNPANSDASRFQAIFDYETQAQLDASLAFIGRQVHSGAHGDLIKLVTDFKISFSVGA